MYDDLKLIFVINLLKEETTRTKIKLKSLFYFLLLQFEMKVTKEKKKKIFQIFFYCYFTFLLLQLKIHLRNYVLRTSTRVCVLLNNIFIHLEIIVYALKLNYPNNNNNNNDLTKT